MGMTNNSPPLPQDRERKRIARLILTHPCFGERDGMTPDMRARAIADALFVREVVVRQMSYADNDYIHELEQDNKRLTSERDAALSRAENAERKLNETRRD